MKSHILALPAALALASAISAAPRLVVTTPTLVPESKIDLVLDQPVVETSELGKETANTLLEVQPAFPGKLKWKAQNIAEFIPDHAPAIGASYTFSISKNQTHLDKTAIPAGKFATMAAEEFRIVAANSPNRWSENYSASTATWLIAFNDDVDPASAAAFFSFASKDGKRVAAKLERATFQAAGYHANNYRTWAARGADNANPSNDPNAATPNILFASPVSPLPPGDDWNLLALKGLPNASASARTTSDIPYNIGDIRPFVVTGVSARTEANEPRRLVVNFNQILGNEHEAFAQAVKITPEPADLKFEPDGKELKISGDFDKQDKFSVSINPPFTSRDGLPLATAFHKEVEFVRLDPELALPSENQAQLAGGTRSYRIHTVNLKTVHVRIKKLAGTDLVRTYQGYRNYTGIGHNGDSVSPTAPLPWPLISGEVLVDKEIALDSALDTSKDVHLNWNELLPAGTKNCALFLDVTGTPNTPLKEDRKRGAQAIIQLTDIGLAWKLTTKDALVYAFSCDSGKPLAGVKLQLFGEDAQGIHQATTDAGGLATLPRSDAARHLTASIGDDTYLTEFDSTLSTVGLWHFPVRYSWGSPVESSRKAFLFTDRSLYRPGETVRLKGIVRTLHGNAIEEAVKSPARIVILDPSEKEILSQPVTISPNGSFDFTHTLAPGKTGTHSLRLEFPEELAKVADSDDESESDWETRERILESARFEMSLRVEEFRRNAFEVTQTIAPPAIGASTATASLGAKYYQGQPVAAGSVKHYSQITRCNPYPDRFRDFYFGNHRSYDWGYWYHYFRYRDDDQDESGHTSNLQGETQLGSDGSATLSIEIPKPEFPQPSEVTISTEVTDANHQTLTASSSVTVHSSSVYAGVSRIDRLVRAGEKVPVRIVAIDTEEKPCVQPLHLTATLTREVNSTVKTRNDNGDTTTRNDVTEETVSTTEFDLDPAASAKEGQELLLSPASTGLHYLTVRGNDPEGRPFATVTRFHVYGTNEYPWQYEDGLRVKMVAEKEHWKPGETARIMVLSPIEGTALVTVEREKILRSFQVELKADKPVIEIPLTDDDAPNAFVSVLIVKGASESGREHKQPQLRLGYCELNVENQKDRLSVAMDTPAESYRPGDQVTLTGTVTDASGKPADGAEVTFYAEDEGTLAVMGYDTPDPMEYFYQPRFLDVESGISIDSFLPEDPDSQDFHNKGFFVGGGGDLDKLAELARRNFDPCATWAPALATDANGRFSHTFKLPDTLTRYRVIAIAHQGVARFGHTESAILVKKDLMLEPKAPRFANQTDTIHPQVLVQNASRYAGTWKIEYLANAAQGTPVCRALGNPSETVSLAPGASATLIFPTLAESTGEAVLHWRATPVSLQNGVLNPELTRNLSDSVESRFQVSYPMPLIRQEKFVRLDQPNAAVDLRKSLDENLLNGSGSIELVFARSPLVQVSGSVDYLLHYPYGCVEQTTSSLIPWCSVQSLRGVVPAFANQSDERVKSALQAGVDRLLSMQLPDGSFSYWPGSTESVPWAAPYAGMGLMLASKAGASVPLSAMDSLCQNLIGSLRGVADTKSSWDLETHARALYVLALAGKPQPAYQSALVDRLPSLTPASRALLAAAIAVGNPADLGTAREIMSSKVSFKGKDDRWMPWSPDDALALLAWTHIDPSGPEATTAVDRILHDRNPYGYSGTTWMNGWMMVALGAYAEHDKNRAESVAINFETNDGVDAIQLSGETPVITRQLALGPNLKLGAAANQSAFVRIKVASKPPVAPIQPVAKNGLSIDRIHQRVKPDGNLETLTEPKPGDLIRVTLRVTLPQDDTRYLVIDDPLPCNFEAVNSDFQSQSSALGVRTSENDWNISHSELRNDRAVFFLDHIWRKGTYTVTYLARCTLEGEAVAPPAKVESMYDPDHFALSASRVFNSR